MNIRSEDRDADARQILTKPWKHSVNARAGRRKEVGEWMEEYPHIRR